MLFRSFGLQIGCLRYLGFFPDELQQIPTVVVDYVAAQFQLSSEVLVLYSQGSSQQRQHQKQIQTLLGYRRATPLDLLSLDKWMLSRALEHDKPLLLFQMACDWLKQNQLIRIGTTRLERRVATVRNQAQEETYEILKPLLTQTICEALDQLLVVDIELERTRLSWLQRTPTDNNPKQILETLDKIVFLQQQGAEDWDLSQLNPNHINHLAKVGSRATNQSLQRSNEIRRYPLLLAFLKQSLYNFTDALIEMVNQRLWELYQDNLDIQKFIQQNLETFNGIPGQPESFDLLDELLSEQFYRLAFWKVGAEELNYRRFFTVNELICLKVDDPDVFQQTHTLTQSLIRSGKFNGLRIDHIDGLYDPTEYLERLRQSMGDTYIVIEKILELDEELPETWPKIGRAHV